MEDEPRTPIFHNNQIEITERTAKQTGELLLSLENRGVEKLISQRFVLQCVLAMFAEDRNLLPRSIFLSYIEDCLKGESSYDVLGGLFQAMNQAGKVPAGRYKGVDYFNGGLFSTISPIELTKSELKALDTIARENWGKVRPAIFGSLFESTVDKKERHARGIHFTSEADIMKVVRPTISRYWEEKIKEATTLSELSVLQTELRNYKVLDPACGSGNFLYIAYQELKRIELWLLDKISQRQRKEDKQMEIQFVSPQQFYGMDTNLFAVELAKVTMAIARKIAIDNLELTEPALPLDTLDSNIVCKDALFSEWQKADAIIGNPPFLGGYKIRLKLGDDYAKKLFTKFSDVKAQIDLSCYWFRLAHDYINNCGRAGLVATNSISQGKSRNASLDYITQNGGDIHDAISSQPWSGEANIHVSVVNWSKQKAKSYYLDNYTVQTITSSLTPETDISHVYRLKANSNYSFVGVQANGKGFFVNTSKSELWIRSDFKNKDILKLSISAKDLTNVPCSKPIQWIIDFQNMNIEEASQYKTLFEHIKLNVKPERENNRESILKEKWWRFKRTNEAMRSAIRDLRFYFIIPRHSKWFIFVLAESNWLPADSTNVVASDDLYVLGILTSNIHRLWVKVQSSTLEDRTRYTHNTCFETFPFPQIVSENIVQSISEKTKELNNYRSAQMVNNNWGITKLYNEFFNEPSSQLHKLHKQLDALAMKAYDFSNKDNILEKLLEMNLDLAEKEKRGQRIIEPYDPNL